ncbi:MAG: hypothetical protein RI912_737 [Actinomycetota bacterium]|jgi:hypothetical protein
MSRTVISTGAAMSRTVISTGAAMSRTVDRNARR